MRSTALQDSPPPLDEPRRRALVVFDSVVGATDQIARAIIGGLGGDYESVSGDIRDVAPERAADFDLIITGEPAQADGTSGEAAIPRVAMKAWLANLPTAHDPQFCACFDTAARADACDRQAASADSLRLLHDLGYVVLSRQTFHLDSFGGPLLAGELDRAQAWAGSLAARIPPR